MHMLETFLELLNFLDGCIHPFFISIDTHVLKHDLLHLRRDVEGIFFPGTMLEGLEDSPGHSLCILRQFWKIRISDELCLAQSRMLTNNHHIAKGIRPRTIRS